ncbi:MAG: CRISPR-associated helicase Cas3' [Proteobacteria bacterium]|nr:CRISPR-associated helicase Cas3' [Pseudomonadota bacterium]
MTSPFFAHKNTHQSTWNPLATHLKNVGKMASCFAMPACKDMAKHAGFWHDLGKYRTPFQEYLANKRPRSKDTHHSVYGAYLAYSLEYLDIAFVIAGHHAGLHDISNLKKMFHDYPDLDNEISKLKDIFTQEVGSLPESIQQPDFTHRSNNQDHQRLTLEFYIRMLFSCLTDADVLDAQRFSQGKKELPQPHLLEPTPMIEQLDAHMETLSEKTSSPLSQLRKNIHAHCRHAAKAPLGLFSLTVPTGGGKTLASMGFALEHAKMHQLERVIVIIPYLSIIEQNARVYRDIFDPKDQGIVVEHHSHVKEKDHNTNNEPDKATTTTHITDNWDAPIVVSTTVQFIESLLSNQPSQCRKLHNIARSVVLLDEVHTLPHHLLDPLLNILRELTTNYQTSIVLSTATQPAFKQSPTLPNGFTENEVTEIIPNPQKYFKHLRRITCHLDNHTSTWQDLADIWSTCHHRALGIVNTKRQARDFYNTLCKSPHINPDHVFHLSSAMCPEHRSDVLKKVHHILNTPTNQQPCYFVTTQVIEAGVDIDFPVVFRAMGPLDSLIQAAGRCNRENRLNQKGKLIIFQPEDNTLPAGDSYRLATNITINFLKNISNQNQDLTEQMISSPTIFSDYFQKLYPLLERDSQQVGSIQDSRKNFLFQCVSKKAQVIADNTTPVIVPYKTARQNITKLQHMYKDKEDTYKSVPKKHLRKLQRYMVSLYDKDLQKAQSQNLLTEIVPQKPWLYLNNDTYDPKLGTLIGDH